MSAPLAGSDAEDTTWDFDHRPLKMRKVVVALAVLTVIVHVIWAVILVKGDTGVTIGAADQFAFVVIGFIVAGVLLTLLRIRVRAGAAGVEVTGPLRSRVWDWADVVGLTFPRSSYFPRLELPAYEHVGLWAIQTFDGAEGVSAMARLREVVGSYKPSAADPESVADR
ncbi:MAG: PH domain-containing protein [Actinomycetales bacterium]|nr:PH domain-containing protein [Actinomycetales bacterium]